MLSLTEFILARIAEDEAVAREADGEGWIMSDGDRTVEFVEHHTPARVLAECEAHRQIVELHSATRWTAEGMEYDLCDECRDQVAPCPTLRALALHHDDHPDYREEWKP